MKSNTIRVKYLLKFGQKQDMENLFNKGGSLYEYNKTISRIRQTRCWR